ncbi:hypothetical protein F5Y14DRAFT_260632 [Nemania sp. NC0429]|nr:hypothetical protein F5Y14DRAFT_260632 [Nemania sp. NC0429]
MSPVAHSGGAFPPSSVAMTSNPRTHTTEPVRGVAYGGNSRPRKEPFSHIDDIVSVGVDLDPHATLRKVLEAGDAHMQQAITFRTFGRPDLALQEYIRAFTIAVDRVPKHKDYPSLKSDRGDLSRIYHALKVKITTNGVAYDEIKEMIKEDNLRSGVRPTKFVSKSSENMLLNLPVVPANTPSRQTTDNSDNRHSRRMDGASRNGPGSGHPLDSDSQLHDNPSPGRKAKPAIHPKPQALHGNSIKPVSHNASPDLATRFAKLRDAQESRNTSSSPLPAKPTGPRAMPLPHRTPVSVRTSLPAMPKIPDAVYSPARGTVTSEAANLPSSTSRGMFSRTNSIVSVPGVSSRASMESVVKVSNREQFVTAHTYGDPRASSASNLRIPTGDLITVKELLQCMEDASASSNIRILIIDVRDRQLYDEGHIMSQATICLDPPILARQNISASEIVDSMILAPTSEKIALERCDETDLIVLYDQDSESLPQRITSNIQEMVLFNLQQALVHYSFPKQLSHTPKLLVGGLDAWVDEMGIQSLQASKTQTIVRQATSTSGSRQRLRNRTLKPDEVNTFEAMIGRDENGDFDYAKSRDDFMRRYPSLREPESMISKEQAGSQVQSTDSGGEAFLKDMTPMPPVRPKPSVARTRYSGLESAEEHSQPPGGLAMIATTSTSDRGPSNPTGLVNPHNWCYANSSIQALLVCRGFMDEFLDSQWPTKYRPDISPSDPAYNQLMCRILGNLFQWLSQRNFAQMKASTLMHYLRTIHSGYTTPAGQTVRFGDSSQHDSDEFITFVFGQLEVETRIKWSLNLPRLDTTQPVGFLVDRWGNRSNHSIVSRHWYLVELHTFTCKNCHARNFIAAESERYGFPVPLDRNDGTLMELVQQHFSEVEVDSECDSCKSRGKIMRKQIARLPPLLRVGLQRTDQTSSQKVVKHLRFPFNTLDLGRHTLDPKQREQIAQILGGEAADGFNCPAIYDLFAVVAHAGTTVNSGHYISYIRLDDDTWTRCNDTHITPHISRSRTEQALHTCENHYTPVQLYYRRRALR